MHQVPIQEGVQGIQTSYCGLIKGDHIITQGKNAWNHLEIPV